MVPSTRLGKEGGTRNGARETAIYVTTRVKGGLCRLRGSRAITGAAAAGFRALSYLFSEGPASVP